jgi:hypothetical protein
MGAVAEAGAVGNVVVSEEDMGVGVTVLHHLPLQFKTNPNSPRLVLSDEVKHIYCTKLACYICCQLLSFVHPHPTVLLLTRQIMVLDVAYFPLLTLWSISELLILSEFCVALSLANYAFLVSC